MRDRARDVRLLGVAIAACVVALGGAGLALAPLGTEPAAQPPRVTPAHDAGVDAAFAQGVEQLRARRYEPAIAAFHSVLERAPAMPEAHANIGFALVGMSRHAEAKGSFERAINLRPAQVNAYFGLAVAAEGLGDLATARDAMRTYLHLAPAHDRYRRRAEAALWEWSVARAP